MRAARCRWETGGRWECRVLAKASNKASGERATEEEKKKKLRIGRVWCYEMKGGELEGGLGKGTEGDK